MSCARARVCVARAMHFPEGMRTHPTVFLSLATAFAMAACGGSDRRAARSPAGPDFSEARPAKTVPAPLAASDGEKVIPPDDQLLFAFDSDFLDREAEELLVQVAAWAKANPAREVVVQGHADRSGDAAYNLDLSQRRARAVGDQLMRLGVARDRVVLLAVGEAEATVEPAPGNRRVIIFAGGSAVTAQSSR